MSLSADSQVADQEMRVRNAARIIVTLSIAAAVLIAAYLFLSWRLQLWQIAAVAALLGVQLGGLLVSARLVRAGRVNTGVWLIIALIQLGFPLTGFFIADVGPVVAVSQVVLTLTVAVQTLPARALNRALLGAGLSTAAAVAIDFFPLNYRLAFPAFNTFIGGMTALIVIVFAYFIVRGFGRFSLRIKLVAAFVIVLVLALGSISYVITTVARNNELANSGNRLQRLAESQAGAVEDRLNQQINALDALALQGSVRDRLAIANASRTESAAALAEAEQRWLSAADSDPFVQARLTSQLAQALQEFQIVFPQYTDLFITNIGGELVAATGRTDRYAYGGEAWWQAALAGGAGSIFLGEPEENAADLLVLPVAVPVYATAGGEVIGVLHASYDLVELREVLLAEQSETLGTGEIYLADGTEFEMEEGVLEIEEPEFDFSTLDAFSDPDVFYIQAPYEEEPSLISQALIGDADSPVVANLGWRVVIRLTEAEALAFSIEQQRNITFLIVAAGLLGTAVAFAMANVLIRPIEELIATTEKIRAGDMATRASVATGDELQALAEDINRTTAQLESTLGDLEKRNRAVEASSEVSRSIASTLDPDQLADIVVTQMRAAFNYYHVQLYLWDESKQALLPPAGGDEEGAAPPRQEWILRAWQQQTAVFLPDVSLVSDWQPDPSLPDALAVVALPVRLGDRSLGVLVVQQNSVNGITAEDVALLQPIANQIATAIENARQVKRTQESEARTRTVLESVTLPMLISRVADGQLLYVNEYAAEVVRMSLAELREKGTPDFYVDVADRQTVVGQIRQQGFVNNYEVRVKRMDGDQFWALLSARLINFAGEPAIITTLIDINDRKEAESALEKQAQSLQSIAEINTQAMSVPDVQEMLHQVTDLVKGRLGLYHAHIYLLNEDRDTLTLTAGAGDVGRELVGERHRIHLGQMQSLVARAARTMQPVLENDVTAVPDHLPNPLLPDTKSELALPLIAGNRVLGVLDVQADSKDYFRDADISIMSTLANQLAASLQGAQSLQRSEETAAQLNLLTQRLTREGWQQFTKAATDTLAYTYDLQKIAAAADNGETWDGALVQPLQVQGEEIGSLVVAKPDVAATDAREVAAAVAARLSGHLENLRLARQTEMALNRTETLYQGGARIIQATTAAEVLTAVIESTSLRQMERASILVFDRPWNRNPETITTTAIWSQPDQQAILPVGTTFPLDQFPIAHLIGRDEPIVLEDIENNEAVGENLQRLFATLRINSLVGVALTVGDTWFGILTAQSAESIAALPEQDIRQIRSLVDQAATVLRNLQLIEETTSRAEQEQLLREVTGRIYAAPDAESILRTAAQEVNRALGMDTFVYLTENTEQQEPLPKAAHANGN